MSGNETDSRIFLIADTHFGDENIRLYEERPFPDTDTMDCSGGQERCRELLSRLKGHKFLVMGNHDSYLSPQQWRDLGFEECYDLPVILKDFFILSHTPLYVNRSMPYANLYGHVHSNPTYRSVSSRSACVSVERIGYAPVLLTDLRNMMQEAE